MARTPTRPRVRHEQHFAVDLVRPSHLMLRSRLLVALAVLGTTVLASLAAFAPELLLEIDRPISRVLHDEDWVPFFRVVTEVGRPLAVAGVAVVAAVALWRRCRLFAVALPATAFAGLVVDVVIKVIVGRRRPPFGVGATEGATSFPSGHVILGVVVLGLLVPTVYLLTARRRFYRAALALFAVYVPTVMISRVVIGAHWFTDVLGSFFVGATLLLGAEYLVGAPLRRTHCACRIHAAPPEAR